MQRPQAGPRWAHLAVNGLPSCAATAHGCHSCPTHSTASDRPGPDLKVEVGGSQHVCLAICSAGWPTMTKSCKPKMIIIHNPPPAGRNAGRQAGIRWQESIRSNEIDTPCIAARNTSGYTQYHSIPCLTNFIVLLTCLFGLSPDREGHVAAELRSGAQQC